MQLIAFCGKKPTNVCYKSDCCLLLFSLESDLGLVDTQTLTRVHSNANHLR